MFRNTRSIRNQTKLILAKMAVIVIYVNHSPDDDGNVRDDTLMEATDDICISTEVK